MISQSRILQYCLEHWQACLPSFHQYGKMSTFQIFVIVKLKKKRAAFANWKPTREKYQNYKDDIAEAENRLENHQRDRVRIGEAKLRTALAGMDFLHKS